MIVISFYTDDRFLEYSKLLRKSLEKHEVKHDIERLPDLGSHRRNVHQKTLFIKRKLDEHLKEDLSSGTFPNAMTSELTCTFLQVRRIHG